MVQISGTSRCEKPYGAQQERDLSVQKSIQLNTLAEYKEYATTISESQLVPKELRGRPADILLALQLGTEVGLSPVQSLQSIAVIQGRPTVWGDAALALVLNSGLCENISETQEDGVATCRVKRRGMDEQSRTFSIDDAKRAGLWGKNVWKSYPERLLQARARGFALRDCFADVLKGLITREEAEDYPTQTKPLPAMADAPRPSLPPAAPRQVDKAEEVAARVAEAGYPEPRSTEEAEVVEAEVVEDTGASVSKAQITKIQAAVREAGFEYAEIKAKIYTAYKIESLKDLPADKVDDCLARIHTAGDKRKAAAS